MLNWDLMGDNAVKTVYLYVSERKKKSITASANMTLLLKGHHAHLFPSKVQHAGNITSESKLHSPPDTFI